MPVLIHPSCFPNIATTAAMVQQSVVWEVCDNYQKQTYRNRFHICTDQGLHRLSVPIKHLGDNQGRQQYANVQVDNSSNWQKQQWRTLQTAYRTSPFFEFYEDALTPIFERPYTLLMDFNWDSLRFICESLQITLSDAKTTTYTASPKEELDLRFLVKAKEILSFEFTPYNQVFGERHGFLGNVSVLDLLFNEGPNAIAYLRKQALPFKDA
ncbi:MAG: WbqC family protein [Bacteroidota bacterium]